jgi:hypothetical protein
VPVETFSRETYGEMLDPWYVTGFCDGEAAFTFSRTGGSFGLYFAVKQRDDNKQIVEELQEFFGGIGSLYQGKDVEQPSQNSGLTKAFAYFRVTKISELAVIIAHFDKYPLQSKKKHEAYCIWREMVKYKTDNYRSIDYLKLQTLAQQLATANSKSRSFKVHSK